MGRKDSSAEFDGFGGEGSDVDMDDLDLDDEVIEVTDPRHTVSTHNRTPSPLQHQNGAQVHLYV